MQDKFEKKSTFKLILSMGIPPILSMLIQSLYSIIDAMYVAKISDDAFNAVSIVYPLQNIILSIAVGLGVAINGCIARNLGKKRIDKVNEFSILGVVLTFIHYLLIVGLAFIVITPFINSNTTDATHSMAKTYINIIAFGSIGVLFQLTFEKILQGHGNMILPTIAQIVGCVLNIFLDHMLVLVFGYGVAGAAIATVAAQGLSALILFGYVLYHNKRYNISFKNLSFNKENIVEIYKVCGPSTLMMSLPSILIMGLNYVLTAFGDMYVNILNLFLKVQTFVYMPVVGLLQGVRPIIGYYYGANKPNKLKEVLKISIVMISSVMLIGSFLFAIVPEFLIKMFFDSEEIIENGKIAFRIFSMCFIFVGVSYLFSTFFESLGYGVVSLIINLSRQFIITIVFTLILVYGFNLEEIGVWYAIVIAEIFTGIMVIIMFKYAYKNTTIFTEKPCIEAVI